MDHFASVLQLYDYTSNYMYHMYVVVDQFCVPCFNFEQFLRNDGPIHLEKN